MKIAIFDFDGTLFPVETIPFLIHRYRKLGYSKVRYITLFVKIIPDIVNYKIFKWIDKEAFRHKAVYKFLELFKGMTQEEVEHFFLDNVEQVMSQLDPVIVKEVQQRKLEGYHTVLLSGCFEMLLKPVGLAVGFDEVIGSHLIFTGDSEQVIDLSQPIQIISGEAKAEAGRNIELKEAIDYKASVAYADSCYDQNILELVGTKICVNPDKGLTEMAKEKNWIILDT